MAQATAQELFLKTTMVVQFTEVLCIYFHFITQTINKGMYPKIEV